MQELSNDEFQELANEYVYKSNSIMSLVDRYELVTLLDIKTNQYCEITKNKLNIYTYVLYNNKGFYNTVSHDSNLYMLCFIRALVIFGYELVV